MSRCQFALLSAANYPLPPRPLPNSVLPGTRMLRDGWLSNGSFNFNYPASANSLEELWTCRSEIPNSFTAVCKLNGKAQQVTIKGLINTCLLMLLMLPQVGYRTVFFCLDNTIKLARQQNKRENNLYNDAIKDKMTNGDQQAHIPSPSECLWADLAGVLIWLASILWLLWICSCHTEMFTQLWGGGATTDPVVRDWSTARKTSSNSENYL